MFEIACKLRQMETKSRIDVEKYYFPLEDAHVSALQSELYISCSNLTLLQFDNYVSLCKLIYPLKYTNSERKSVKNFARTTVPFRKRGKTYYFKAYCNST